MKKIENSVDIDPKEIRVSPYFFRDNPAEEDLQRLADSIKALGQIHPVSVVVLPKKSAKGHKYELINGHRRYLATNRLGLERIRAEIYEYTPEELASEEERMLAVTEFLYAANNQEPLTPLERARRYKELIDKLEMGVGDIAALTGASEDDIQEDLKYTWIAPSVQEIISQPENAGKIRSEHLRILADWSAPAKKGWRLDDEGQKKMVEKLVRQEDKRLVIDPAQWEKEIKNLVQEVRRQATEAKKKEEEDKKKAEASESPGRLTAELFRNLNAAEKGVQKLTQTELPVGFRLSFIDRNELLTKTHILARELVNYAVKVGAVEELPEAVMAGAEEKEHGN